MKITEKWLKNMTKDSIMPYQAIEFNAYFKKHNLFDLDSSEVAKNLIKNDEIEIAYWFIAHSLNKVEKLNLAILIGEKVLPIYEKMYQKETLPGEIITLMKKYRRYLSKNNNIINLNLYDENYSKLLEEYDEYLPEIINTAYDNSEKNKDFEKAKDALITIEAIDGLFGRDNIKEETVDHSKVNDGQHIEAALLISNRCVKKSDFDEIFKFGVDLIEKNEKSKELNSKSR